MKFSIRIALTAPLLSSAALPDAAEQVFNRIASFAVASNLPAGQDSQPPPKSSPPAKTA